MNNRVKVIWNESPDPERLATDLAGELATLINNAIADKGSAVLALSGGSTPKPLFKALAEHDLEWSKVIITLVDERWVPETHELSNAAFIKKYLLSKLPDSVTFVPLYKPAASVKESFTSVLDAYSKATDSTRSSPRPFDIVILGMGNDGHTASFFPDADNVTELVAIDSPQPLLSCISPNTQVERVTWSLPMLLNTGFLALHFTGLDKLAVFKQAAVEGEMTELPIRCAIHQDRTPLNIYYSD